MSLADALEIPIGPTGILAGAALADDRAAPGEIQRDDLVTLALDRFPVNDDAQT